MAFASHRLYYNQYKESSFNSVLKGKTISFYDDSFLNAFFVCVLQFYDVFFFYRKACVIFLLVKKYILIKLQSTKVILTALYVDLLLCYTTDHLQSAYYIDTT